MSSQGLGHNFKSSPSGLLVPSSVWNATLNAADVTHEMVGPADASKFLRGDNPPTWALPQIDVIGAGTDITTNNVSTTKHGLAPKAPNDGTKFLDGTAAYDTVKDSDLSTSDITTNDVTTAKHGFVPKAPNDAAKFLRGDGVWATVGGSGGGVVGNDAIWDTKGDLAAATGPDAAVAVPVGANNTILTADSTQPAGIKWAAPAAVGFVQLADSTLGASAASFDLTSISGSYIHLILVMYLRNNRAAALNDEARIRLNNDSGANYDYTRGTFVSATGFTNNAEVFAATSAFLTYTPAVNATADSFGGSVAWIHNYANTTGNKTVVCDGIHKQAVTTLSLQRVLGTGAWRSNAAITRITIFPSTGANWIAGSRVTLYGVA